MHNVALDLQAAGHQVSGSDDAIFEPSRTRLEQSGLLPISLGWFEENITEDLDLVVLGMHAKGDNPELLKALKLGLKVQSFPEYVAEASKDKHRLVIAGSHGKTSTTAMVMHVLNSLGRKADYLIGSQLKGFDKMVKLTDAPLIVLEGDEYLSSPIDLQSKFLHYRPHVAIITGIAWDHINVFPTWESYVDTFRKFISEIEDGGTLIYYLGDETLAELAQEASSRLRLISYSLPKNGVRSGISYLELQDGSQIPLKIFGSHNLENLEAARLMTQEIGVSQEQFNTSIQSFSGADRRLETIFVNKGYRLIKDFAHAPSKVKASMRAVREQFPNDFLVACFEPHTYSSLSPEFMKQYAGTLNSADKALLFLDVEAFTLKGKTIPEIILVEKAFQCPGMEIILSKGLLVERILAVSDRPVVIMMMSSGNWGGVKLEDLPALAGEQLDT